MNKLVVGGLLNIGLHVANHTGQVVWITKMLREVDADAQAPRCVDRAAGVIVISRNLWRHLLLLAAAGATVSSLTFRFFRTSAIGTTHDFPSMPPIIKPASRPSSVNTGAP